MDDAWRILNDLGADGTMAGLSCAAKASGVLACAGLVAFAMNRRAAATRHLVWVLGMAGALAVLPLALALPRWQVPVLPAPVSDPRETEPDTAPELQPADGPLAVDMPISRGEAADLAGSALETPDRPRASRLLPPVAWPVMIWAAGTLAVLAWGAAGWAATWWLGRRAECVTDPHWVAAAREAAERLRMRSGVTLLRGGPAAMPLTWGVLRPVVLLPEEADLWPVDRRRAVLLHELAHVRRRDCLTQWLGLAACAAYWFNPLAWWGASRLRCEREQACDDLVLEAGERPSDYAAQLLGVARSLRPPRPSSPVVMAMARPSGLEQRLLAILDAHRNRRSPARWLVVACLAAVLAVSATLATLRLVAKEPPRKAVSGMVVGPDENPIAGADMVVVASRLRWRYRDSDQPAAQLLGRGRADEQGRFRIELGAEPESDEGLVTLVATAPGYGFTARELAGLNAPIEGPLRLTAEQPVEVRLVNLEGAPIAGADVSAESVYPARGGTGLPSEILAHDFLPPLFQKWTSDQDGRFMMRGYGPNHTAFLDIRAPGFGKQRLRVETKAGAGTTALTLGRAHIVEGRVTLGKDGPPAIGARIKARSMSEKHGIGMNSGDDEVMSDSKGRYRIEAAPSASIVLKVYPPRAGADEYLMRGHLVVPGDSITSRVDFALPKGVLVRGRVTEAGTGRPVAGAIVHHEAHERNNPFFIKGNPNVFNRDEQQVATAADGTFRLGIMPGPGYLLVKGPTADYVHQETTSIELDGSLHWPNTRTYPDAFQKLSPKPDEGPVDIELKLRRGATVSGRLVDGSGQPERDAVLLSRWYLSSNGMTVNHYPAWKTLRDGRFELRGCDPGSSAPVLFLDAKKQRGAAIELSGKQAGEDVEVTMQPCGSATVRLVDDAGKPLRAGLTPAHIEVVLTPGPSFAVITMGDQKTSPVIADSIYVANLDIDRYRDLKTDTGGRMTFPTLIPGATYQISVFNQPVKTEIEFTVKPGEMKDLGDLKIRNLRSAT